MIRINIKGGEAASIAMSSAPALMMRHLRTGLHRAAEEVARAEKHAAPKAFGALVQSIKATRVDAMRYRVSAGVHYAAGIEEGTDPGVFPPVQNILEWLRIKRIEPEDDGTSSRDLAFMIARGIARNGKQANPFFYPTAESMAPRAHEIVRQAINTGVGEALA